MWKWLILTFFCVGCTYNVQDEPQSADDMGKLGWTQSGDLFTQNTGKNVKLNADFKEKPGVYTVQFSIDSAPAAVAGISTPFACQATVVWSVEGGNIKRRFNIANGVSISAPAQGVQVTLEDVTPSGAANPGQQYSVAVQVVEGTRPSIFAPQLLGGKIANLNNGAPVSVNVPLDAGVKSVLVSAISNAFPTAHQVAIEQRTIDSSVNLSTVVINQSGITEIPIHPECGLIEFFNFDAANGAFVTFNWGIDG